MTRQLAIWAAVAAADRFTVSDREEIARQAARNAERVDRATLVTCHRVEVYGVGDGPDDGRLPGVRALDTGGELDGMPVTPATLLRGEDAVGHLSRLAVGLESAVLGEDQVLHQVRQTLAVLRERHADARLIRLFEVVVGAGRRARAEHPAADRNLGELAVRWLERRTGPLRARPVVVAGAGPMGRLAIAAFARRGAEITVASRSLDRARVVTTRTGGQATDLAAGARMAASVSGVVVALGGPWPEFTGSGPLTAGESSGPRHEFASPGPAPVVDLSFPLAVPVEGRERLGDAFADVDRIFREAGALQTDGPGGPAGRDFRVGAEAIVREAVATYHAWSAGRPSVSTLRALRDRSEEHRRAEWERLLRRLPDLEPREQELVEAFSQRLVAGLLHAPSAALRDDIDGSAATAAERLFRL